MDLTDDEDFYDSDQSDIGDQSLHAILKKSLYDKDNTYNNFDEQIPDNEEVVGNIQEEVLGKVTDIEDQEIILGPVNNKKIVPDTNESENIIGTDETIIQKLDQAQEVVLAPEIIGELDKNKFFDDIDDDNFEPLKKKQKLNFKDNNEENPHKTIVMHVPQFFRCNKGGQSIQVQ